MPVIEVEDLAKSYGQIVAVDGVSFAVEEGEIFGMVGPNGAGKTTTVEMIEGLREPDRGTARVLGLELGATLVQLPTDFGHRVIDHPLAHVVVRRWPDPYVLQVVLEYFAGERIEMLQVLDLVSEQQHAVG